MANYRRGRIKDEVRKALSEILREVKDPRVRSAFISITGAEVTPDLKYAKIYYSLLGADGDREKEKKVADGLKSSNGFIRGALARALDLRQTPELNFILDRSGANGAYISSLLHKVEADSAERAARLGKNTPSEDDGGDN